MKRFVGFFVLLVAICSFVLCCAEEQSQPETLLFRDIPWFETEKNVLISLSSVQTISNPYMSKEYRISGPFTTIYGMYSSPNIRNGGCAICSSDASMAGYKTRLACEFIYPIVDGHIVRDPELAQFFTAEYTLPQENTDTPLGSVYAELKGKLALLYGEPTTTETTDSGTACSYWYGADNSCIYLFVYYNTYHNQYEGLKLSYSAPNAVDLLNSFDEQIQKERYIEQSPVDDTNATVSPITFQGIEWYTSEKDVNAKVVEISTIANPRESKEYRISGPDPYAWGMYSNPNLRNGGAAISSSEAQVAGYKMRLTLEFIYPIVDGWIVRKQGDTQFFKAEYSLSQESTSLNLGDVYKDLKEKLTQKYGNLGKSQTTDGFTSYSYWYGEDGSTLLLVAFYYDGDNNYQGLKLIYSAPEAATRIRQLEQQIEDEKIAETVTPEPETIDSGNFDGL